MDAVCRMIHTTLHVYRTPTRSLRVVDVVLDTWGLFIMVLLEEVTDDGTTVRVTRRSGGGNCQLLQ